MFVSASVAKDPQPAVELRYRRAVGGGLTHRPVLMPLSEPTRSALLADATRRLNEAGLDPARRQAEWLLEEVLGVGRAQLIAFGERPVPPEAAARFEALVARRLQREPLQYLLGHTDFFGLRLTVTPDVLIPRPETEQLVEHALSALEGIEAPRVLDVGTGSGCIPLALKHARPDAAAHACDISPAALAVARANAEALGLDVAFFEADVLAPAFADHAPGALDLLVSNPPYIPDAEASTLEPEVREHEPHAALFSGTDALVFYRTLARLAPRLLRPGALLAVEVHADYGPAVRALFAETLTGAELARDLAGLPRIVTARRPG